MGKLKILWLSLRLAILSRDFSVFKLGMALCLGVANQEEYERKMNEKKLIWLEKQRQASEKKWDEAK